MAENKNTSYAVGSQAVATTLDKTTKLDIDTTKQIVDDILIGSRGNGINTSEIEKFTSIANSRDQIYTIIDTMAKDSSVAAILKTFADSACEPNDHGHTVWCESTDPKISKFINYLLGCVNVDKKVYGWTYCLAKYGDVYLRLYRESDYTDTHFKRDAIEKAYSARNTLTESAKKDLAESITLNVHGVDDSYTYYVEAVSDPGTFFELTKMGTSYGYIETPNVESNSFDFMTAGGGISDISYANYKMKSSDINLYQADDFVHGCLEEDFSRFPEKVELFDNNKDFKKNKNATTYSVRRGKSMLIDNYKVWREKTLLENSILLNRVTRSSIVRIINTEVGDMPKEQASQVLRRVKELFEQKTAYKTGESMAEYNNPGPIENNIYLTTHNGQGAITVSAVGGDVDVKGLADLDSWVNKFYAGYGIPKAYFGYTDDGAGFNGGTSLSIISSQFAKGVKHLQNAIIQMITDMINLFLVNKGLKAYLNNFKIKMKAPLTQEEIDSRDNFNNRANAISSVNSLFGEVEDKSRRLEILKTLVSTLNYGDEITSILDEEIKATKQKEKEEAEQAEKEAAEQAELEANEAKEESSEPEEEPQLSEVDLDSIAPESGESGEENPEDIDLAPMPDSALEGFNNRGTEILNEDSVVITEENDLPTPEEIGEDFTKTK